MTPEPSHRIHFNRSFLFISSLPTLPARHAPGVFESVAAPRTQNRDGPRKGSGRVIQHARVL